MDSETQNIEELPNVMLISSHDTGTYFHCLDAPIETPNIDTLARGGTICTNHFASAPQCSPSRGSILTGKMPHVHGLMGLVGRGWRLPRDNLTLPKLLRKTGYSTTLVGLQHEHVAPKRLGYEHVTSRKDYPYHAKVVTRKFKKFLQKVETGAIKQPFFCSVGFFETHRPFATVRDDQKTPISEVEIPPYLPNTRVMRQQVSSFEALVRLVDEKIGELHGSLQETSFFENTLVIFTVDHGWAFPRAKCTLYDSGIKTPLILSMPGKIPRGKKYERLISNVDIMPTVLDLLRVPKPANIQGRSHLKNIFGKDPKGGRKEIFAELTFHDEGYNPIRAIRTKKWKYIANFSTLRHGFEMSIDVKKSPAGKVYTRMMPEYKFKRPGEELYDLEDDPLEMNNKASEPSCLEVLARLRAKLLTYMTKTSDPVLHKRKPRLPPAFSRKMREPDPDIEPVEIGFYED
ncbi:MAG: sulfatase [Candidatus Hodarchaeota archaeon]